MKTAIKSLVEKIIDGRTPVEVFVPEYDTQGHYSTNVALRLAKLEKKNPVDLAGELKEKILASAPKDFFEKIEVAPPGFINFWISSKAVCEEFKAVSEKANFGIADALGEKTVMVEYTDLNPFKQFHVGHLMTNFIGEAIARLHEAAGAKVLRVNYQGDVGLHVAKTIWGMMRPDPELPDDSAPLMKRMEFLGNDYIVGVKAYGEDPFAKKEIDELNKKVYERSDEAVNRLYDLGRKWSLDYFETIYERLGTKFVHYFFESEVGPVGAQIVRAHPEVFTPSEGAVIFPGEKYGLHNRVFINSLGLPTYEAKELGLNKTKFDLYHPDLSLIVTGNEINEYFRVLKKAMELVLDGVAEKTIHVGHGMLRLPTGKMSSRSGEVITPEMLIDKVKLVVEEKTKDRENIAGDAREKLKEDVALAAIRYSILRQGIGKDIIFDIEKSVAFQGDSGPYLQYTYARLRNIFRKANSKWQMANGYEKQLTNEVELRVIRKLLQFPDVVRGAVENLAPNHVAQYLLELANESNRFYETVPVLQEEDEKRRQALLALIDKASSVLKSGLNLLGIKAPEEI